MRYLILFSYSFLFIIVVFLLYKVNSVKKNNNSENFDNSDYVTKYINDLIAGNIKNTERACDYNICNELIQQNIGRNWAYNSKADWPECSCFTNVHYPNKLPSSDNNNAIASASYNYNQQLLANASASYNYNQKMANIAAAAAASASAQLIGQALAEASASTSWNDQQMAIAQVLASPQQQKAILLSAIASAIGSTSTQAQAVSSAPVQAVSSAPVQAVSSMMSQKYPFGSSYSGRSSYHDPKLKYNTRLDQLLS